TIVNWNYGIYAYYLSPAGSVGPEVVDGDYTVQVSNAAGSTNVGTWRLRAFYPGMVAVWGAGDSGQLDRPPFTNTLAIAAGDAHSIAVRDDGMVAAWGANNYGQTNVPSGLTNAVS